MRGPSRLPIWSVIALSYLAVSISITLLFYLLATRQGKPHTPAEVALGSVWTFILSLIISASILPPILKKRLGGVGTPKEVEH